MSLCIFCWFSLEFEPNLAIFSQAHNLRFFNLYSQNFNWFWNKKRTKIKEMEAHIFLKKHQCSIRKLSIKYHSSTWAILLFMKTLTALFSGNFRAGFFTVAKLTLTALFHLTRNPTFEVECWKNILPSLSLSNFQGSSRDHLLCSLMWGKWG